MGSHNASREEEEVVSSNHWTINVLVTGFGVLTPTFPSLQLLSVADSPPLFLCCHSLLETTAKTRPTSSPAVSLRNITSPVCPQFIFTHTQTQSQYPTAPSVTSSPPSFSPSPPPLLTPLPPPHPPPYPPPTTMASLLPLLRNPSMT